MTNEQSFTKIESDVLNLPPAVGKEFNSGYEKLKTILNEDEIVQWAAAGYAIAQQSFRSWEAAAEFYRVSPNLLQDQLPISYLESWSSFGRELAAASASLAIAYFRTTPEILKIISPDDIPRWAGQGQRLYQGTWKSSALSSHFFENSASFLALMPLDTLEDFVSFLEVLSQKSHDLAEECLNNSPQVFSEIARDDIAPLISLLQKAAETNWKYAKESLESGAVALQRIDPQFRVRFLQYAEEMILLGGKHFLPLLNDGSRALAAIPTALHGEILFKFDELSQVSKPAAVDFLIKTPNVLSLANMDGLGQWYQQGLETLSENEDAGISYFKLESSKGDELLEALSARIELTSVHSILQMYGRALTGEEIDIVSTKMATQSLGWLPVDQASTDGRSINLPTEVARFKDKEENFSWYKVVSTHQVGHLEFESFAFSFDRDATHFPRWRDDMNFETSSTEVEAEEQVTTMADFQKYFDLFPDRQLASDIFGIVEAARIDQRIIEEYPGLRTAYDFIRQDAVANRKSPDDMPLQEGILEILIRMTLLESPETIRVPTVAKAAVDRIAAVLIHLRQSGAQVEDSAEATLRIYRIVAGIPNLNEPETDWQDIDIGELGQEGSAADTINTTPDEAETADEAGSSFQMVPNNDDNADDGEESEYESPETVDYRGDFKPELVQVIANLRETSEGDEEAGASIDPEALKRLAEESTEINLENVVDGAIDESAGMFVSELMSDILNQSEENSDTDSGRRPAQRKPEQEGPLEEEPGSVLYREWDFKANDYKPRWARVREVPVTEGTSEFYDRTQEHHAMLITQIRRQFEMMVPELHRKEKKLPDGEDIDIDLAVESIIERRAGSIPSEKIYWRRNKVQRDVAVIFLLDMSASTAEAIDEKARDDDEWKDIPDDPREYLFWLRARREAAKRNYKRIIDIERESTVLLIRALEATGDMYGIHGFSGYGRENVEFYTIKDIDETFTNAVPKRIDGISPLHATRMGPAIRHATSKLKDVPAKTKLLFLISDGRPQDRGYSREGVDKEYAVQDTHKALLEAKTLGITPFCLTVDRSGHDYMKEMCGDMAYEVLEDVASLPERLPQLYRSLTV